MTYPDLPRPEVPAPVAVVRDFINTTDHETGADELTTTTQLQRYLSTEGLLTASSRATSEDLALARRLRSALRRSLEQNHDGGQAPLPELSTALGELRVGLDWSDDGPVLVPAARGVSGALAMIGIATHRAATEGRWWRMKICSSDECEWAYYDHSKNRSRQWCEYGCGNRVKTRAYRARQRALAT